MIRKKVLIIFVTISFLPLLSKVFLKLSMIFEYRVQNQRSNFQRNNTLLKSKMEEKLNIEDARGGGSSVAVGTDHKLIVTGTNFSHDLKLWEKVFHRLLKGECEENRCILSTNEANLPRADAVMFSSMDMSSKGPAHSHRLRKAKQFYIYFSMEAPHEFNRKKLKKYENFFNWTMTNRRDSDIFIPYGRVTKRSGKAMDVKYLTQDDFDTKKMAVFFSSHCSASSKRLLLVENLQSYIPVDFYGECGTKACGNRTIVAQVGGKEVSEEECVDLIREYLFYFSFENTLCTEYVTEKVYRPLSLGIVPVVYGGVDYSAFTPPNSVIDAKKFSSVAKLAEYLQKVARNITLYNGYLKWRESYEVEVGSPYKPFVCDLCNKLHSKDIERTDSEYESIEKWVLDGNEKCFNYEDVFKEKI